MAAIVVSSSWEHELRLELRLDLAGPALAFAASTDGLPVFFNNIFLGQFNHNFLFRYEINNLENLPSPVGECSIG